MKELSIEDKAKAYDKALEALRSLIAEQAIKHCDRVNIKDITNIFSELKESEDERMLNQLHSWMKEFGGAEEYTEKVYQWIKGLLEKKAEQKPAWSEEDEYQVNTILHGLDLKRELYKKEGNKVEEERYNTQYNWLKSLKERIQLKQEWSEEDESHIRYLIECLEHCKKGVALTMITSTSQEYINWLKSLRPQNRWKPSEEQMKILGIINVAGCITEPHEGEVMISLYNDLKKLTE